MGTGNITWHSFNSIPNRLLILEQITSNRLCENANYGSLAVLDHLKIFRLFMSSNHVFVGELFNPSLFEVCSAEEKRVLLCKYALNLAYGSKNSYSVHGSLHFEIFN